MIQLLLCFLRPFLAHMYITYIHMYVTYSYTSMYSLALITVLFVHTQLININCAMIGESV